ncbi:DUF3772 domain-containing protein [Rhodobacter lacus]|uniref:DUF3772 domain-containing protein n=1 Tax=Rhodobacter lacus TaxID=1641972 RepID=A0ABW5AB09_9RHOB
MNRTVLRALALTLALVLAVPAMAEISASDIKAFTKVSQKVEDAVAEAAASESTLSEMRAEMVKWRTTFTAEQDANADQIATVKSQIAALGPAPEEGATEDALIAKRRTELTEQLAKLQAPGITATEAASRADSIIRTIDKLVRERQADKLLRLSPSVANPVNWPAAASLVRWMGAWIYDETRWRFTQPVNYDELRTNAPLIIGLVLAALVLLARGRRWMMRATDFLLGKTAMRGRNLISGLVSLGQVVLPVLGANLLVIAIDQTSLFGPILSELFRDAPVFLFTVLMAWWLGARIFPARPGVESTLSLGEDGRAEGRIHAVSLGFAFAAHQLLLLWVAPHAEDFLGATSDLAADQAQAVAERADAALSVLQAPLQIFAAVGLFRMGQLLRRKVMTTTEGDDGAFRRQLMRWLGTALLLIALAAPVLGVIGYVSAADALIWPAVASLGLFAAVATVQAFLAELYVTLARGEEVRRDALLPVLGGFLIALASLPLLALIWGARIEDLLELWTSFQNGVAVGGVRISPTSFITFAVVFGIGYALTRLLQGALKSTILPKTSLDKGGQNAITSGIGYVGLASAALVAISTAGIDLSSLAIVAGALSVGIGFGLQTIVQNFVSGIILLIERPISEGDWIEVGGYQGIVKAISVRSTVVETFDRTDVIVPNADLISGSVTNWTRGNKTGRLVVPVGVSYGTDTRKVEKILAEIAQAHPLVMMTPAPFALFMGFGADSMDFEIRAILSDVNFKLRVLSEMNHQIAERFAAEGIEIPFAQRDIWIRNPETLQPEAGPRCRPCPPPEARGEEACAVAPEPPEPGEGIARLSDNDGREDGDDRDAEDGDGPEDAAR